MDVASKVMAKLNALKKDDNARYFLVRVQHVAVGTKNKDTFKVTGERVDTGQIVSVISTKSSSGQYMPEVGGVLRADKPQRMPTHEGTTYIAEYYLSYRQDDFCLNAIIQPSLPRLSNNMWSANVQAFDREGKGSFYVRGDEVVQGIEAKLLQALKPWENQIESDIMFDVKGAPLWADGSVARPGLNPFVVIRLQGQAAIRVYGKGAINDSVGGAPAQYRMPHDSEILEAIRSSSGLSRLKTALSELGSDDLASLKLAIIPGLSISVGRESLAGEKRKYLGIPQAFHNEQVRENGLTEQIPGYREAYVSVRQSRQGRLMVVDAAHAARSRLSTSLPLIPMEKEYLYPPQGSQPKPAESKSSKTAEDDFVHTPQPQANVSTPAQRQQPQPNPATSRATRSAPTPAEQFEDDFDESMESFDDIAMYSHDMAAIEEMNAEADQFQPDDGLDQLFQEAEERVRNRDFRPRM